jgi:ATP-dependent DNA helicase RecQ
MKPNQRVDYISDILGIEVKNVIAVVNLLRDEKILADAKDLTAFIKKRREQKPFTLQLQKVMDRLKISFI